MNEKINLIEILKDCPQGTKLYSTVFGDVKFESINEDKFHPIIVRIGDDHTECFSADGKIYSFYDGECVLFPSKEERDWSKFNPKTKQTKFDPKTLQAFDRVLAREDGTTIWAADIVSVPTDGTINIPILMGYNDFGIVIPYNNDTKHLIGTTEEAPEYYRYWED